MNKRFLRHPAVDVTRIIVAHFADASNGNSDAILPSIRRLNHTVHFLTHHTENTKKRPHLHEYKIPPI